MSSLYRANVRVGVLIVIISLASGLAVSQIPATAEATAFQQLKSAWENARLSGEYEYRTELVQTSYPAPALTNVGRTAEVNRIYMEGSTNLAQKLMELKLWSQGGSVMDAAQALEIKIEGDKALGRVSGGTWEEVNNVGAVFAPQGDAMAHPAAAKNVQPLGEQRIELGDLAQSYHKYQFDFDGPAFAYYMRQEMLTYLRQQEGLPPGMDIGVSDTYRQMTGSGQLWVDSAGMPARLTMDLSYPAQANGDKVAMHIQTDFADFAPLPASWWTVAAQWGLPITGEAWQAALIHLTITLAMVGVVMLSFAAVGSPKLYAAFSWRCGYPGMSDYYDLFG